MLKQKNNISTKDRLFQLDIVRSFAVFFVISVHFLSYIGFYEQNVSGLVQYVLMLVRVLFITCVPLFMLLTGYLMKNKVVEKKYYARILEIVLTYLVCGAICQTLLFITKGAEYSIRDGILSFFSFKAAPYGWYIEMYIGLFLLIPFLNVLWKNLSDKQKKILIITLIFITASASIFNIFDFTQAKWWIGSVDSSTKIIQSYWTIIYPLTYYFLGCYFEENKDLVKKVKVIYLIGFIILFGTINYFKYYNNKFLMLEDTAYGGYQAMIISVLIFLLCLKIERCPNLVKKCATLVSKFSLEIYMLSFVVDRIVYFALNKFVNNYTIKAISYFLVVPIILFVTLVISYIVGNVIKKFCLLIKIKERKNKYEN